MTIHINANKVITR